LSFLKGAKLLIFFAFYKFLPLFQKKSKIPALKNIYFHENSLEKYTGDRLIIAKHLNF